MEYATYSPDMLPAIVRFWNNSFREKRNFFPVTEEILRSRIFEKETAAERFDPRQFLVAVEGGETAGLLHYLVRGEGMCRAINADWPGGEQGCIAFFFVAEPFRRRGIGRRLFETALDALKHTRQVVIDTQCHNPFYGNSTGPRTPLWGHTEGIGIDIDDTQTISFLKSRGFATTDTAHSLLLETETKGTGPPLLPFGCSLRTIEDVQPVIGAEAGVAVPYDEGCRFVTVACIRDDITVGAITFYEMKEVEAGKGAIYLLEVAEKYRRGGVGRALVAAAVNEMCKRGWKSCEALTIPLLSPGAIAIYEALGFRRVARWAIY